MKKFTYSFLSILMLLLAMPAGLLARTTVTFDFAANPWNLPLSSNTSGEADKGAITSPILQDGVILTTTDGSNKTKMWVTNSAIDLRVYKSGGTFTFTAPTGKVIEKIEFTGTVAATADAGTYDGSSKTWAQPKEQVNAVKFTATGTNKISKAILTIADPGEGAEVVVLPEIPDFASLKAAEQDKAVKLTVTNAKVVYAGSKDLIVEDATGAIDFYNWGIKATAGQVINGTVEAKYAEFFGMPQAAKTANTDVTALTITDGDAVAPVAMTFADAMKATSYLKYVTLTDFTIEKADGNTYLVSGENKIQLYNKFKVEYTLPEAIKSISGIIIPFVAKGSSDVIVEIAPTCAEDIVEEATAKVLEVNNLAELRAIKVASEWDEVPVKLNLHDAKITALHKSSDYGMEMIDFAILEDATGAIDISSLMMEATAEGLLEGNFEEGSVLNGTLYATYNWPNTLWTSEDTEKSQITLTPSTVVPTEATLAEVMKPENDLRLFKLQDVTIKNVGTEETPDFDICQGEASIELRDVFAKWASDGSDMPEKLQSVTGILYAGYESLDQETPKYFFTPLSYEETPAVPEIPVVENIAALRQVEGGEMENPSVKLMLKNAKITYVQNTEGEVDPEYSVMYALLEDETGAVEISDLVAKANLNNWFKGELKEGVALNGYVIVDYSSFFPRLVVNAETAKSEVTITPTEITPTVVTIADVQKPENHLRMFELQNVELVKEGEGYAFKQDGNIIAAVDMFKNMLDEMPTNLESVTGVLFLDLESYCFVPTSYLDHPSPAPIEVNSIAELNKLGEENEGATIKLKLTDAQITVADAYMNSAIIEDKTGAFNAQYFFAEAVGTEMLKDEFKQGVVLNGYLYATYSYGSIEVCDLTAESNITTAEAPVVATEADFAEVLKAENNFRLYEFKNITVNKNESDKFQLVKGDAKAEIADRTGSLDESMMANVESVVGYFRIAGDDAEFTLLSYKTATPDGISVLEVAAKNAAVYNMNGAKVLGAGESVKGLAKGIYVVGGKKIVVK